MAYTISVGKLIEISTSRVVNDPTIKKSCLYFAQHFDNRDGVLFIPLNYVNTNFVYGHVCMLGYVYMCVQNLRKRAIFLCM